MLLQDIVVNYNVWLLQLGGNPQLKKPGCTESVKKNGRARYK